ncbi:phage/plasmid primase, P4 family [Thiothrix lacustris]|uniref:Phage/plasmid primase, P4 family n=1 Tax=Thiothrix lacustris TaxID=525917 RepID=A0ABY9MS45_9GAMM|nr:phage/plasmid primase, P4 family [Thiothrix lacustris]WML91252.1 phage/plasmid primase, P4 family [Thiothrix lacustris]
MFKSFADHEAETIPNTDIDGELPQNKLASAIAEKLLKRIRWDDSTQQWFSKSGNIWKPSREIAIQKLIKRELDKAKSESGYAFALVSNIEKFMRIDLQVEQWETSRHLLPMANGVLNLRTKALEQYGERLFDWQLPYSFDSLATCPTVKRYLMTATGKDKSVIRFLLAWMYAVLTGRSDLQKYLELTGSGGTGKSTFLDLCSMLVGDENRVITDLKQLEKSQFETANLKGKRLAQITDSGRHGGEVAVLKAITGGDPLRYEKKGIQAAEPFVFSGLVMIAANEAIQSSDYTSGLARRKIPVQFEHRATEKQKRRYRKQGGIIKAMQAQMSGLVNWLLSLDESEVVNLINNPDGEMKRQKVEAELKVNPVLAWLDERVVQCSPNQEEDYIGTKKQLPSEGLYPNYVDYCEGQGREPMAIQRFSSIVLDNCRTYGIETTHKQGYRLKTKGGQGAILSGLRLRTEFDSKKLPLISSCDELRDVCDEAVMKQTRSSDGCDERDELKASTAFGHKKAVNL